MKKKLMIAAASMALAFSFSMTACAQPQTMPDGTVFDAEYYAQANPDVVAAFGWDTNLLYLHYIQFGKAEGRAPVSGGTGQAAAAGGVAEEFDAAFYAQTYPDVAAVLGTDPAVLYQHYIQVGKAQGRIGTPSIEEQYKRQVFLLANEERSKAGLPLFVWDDSLKQAADIRAAETTLLFEHTRPDGRDCFTIIDELGISGWTFGENIAAGQKTPEVVHTSWMNSLGHRANIMNGAFQRLGVGYYVNANGRSYWVQLFAG